MPTASRRMRANASSSIAVTARPASTMLPELARSSPASTISRLVLPDPDGPMIPTASPATISRSMPRRMLTGPAAEGTVRCRFLTCTSGTGDGKVASMAAPYGVRGRWRKAIIALALMLPTVTEGAPVRLLVLGDSLSAGYGLAQPDGFEAQLGAALRAGGHEVAVVGGGGCGGTLGGGPGGGARVR